MNKMHATKWSQAAMLPREDRRGSHWRQPWTSDSLALGSEMKTKNSPHWACHRHMSKVGLFAAVLSKPAPFTVSVFRVFSCYKGIKGVFQALLLAIRVYTLCGFISHHVGEPAKC